MGSLAATFATSKTVIRNVILRGGGAPRPRGARCDVETRHDAFDVDGPQTRYWIGFLMADGCILANGRRTPAVQLALGPRDIAHVAAFADFCGARYAGGARASFASAQICGRLAEYGIGPRKSGSERAPECLRMDRDFWRGIVDGDGWVTPRQTIGVCGSKQICVDFAAFAHAIAGSNVSPMKISGRDCWQVTVHGKGAIKIMRTLYRDGDVALPRKSATVNVILYDRMAKSGASLEAA